MTRLEYMDKLRMALSEYEDDFARDIMEDYKRHFDEAIKDGRTEESVCEELGNVEDFINDIPEAFKKKVKKDTFTSGEKEHTASDEKECDVNFEEEFDKFTKEAGKMFDKAGKVASGMAESLGNAFTKLGEMLCKSVEEAYTENKERTEENEEVNNSLSFGEYIDVKNIEIGLIDANVEVTMSNSSSVNVSLSRPLTKKEMMYYEVSNDDNTLKITAGLRNGHSFNFLMEQPLTFYVAIPYNCRLLKLSTVSGSICVRGDIAADEVAFDTVSGRITFEELVRTNNINVKSVSGTVCGNINANNYNITTVSGKVDVGFDSKAAGRIETVSGGIRARLLRDIGASVKSTSMSGSLKVHTDKRIVWDEGENVVMMGIFNKGTRSAAFGEEGLKLKTHSVSGSVKIYDFDKNE